ncbi:MAG: 4-carboxy-4-hydroxy-2-oxoadipate aldolase/oxaloacetate decarboxylase [Anaerolineae bacterium]|nr:4-carboxy-4-hydroxy-2-oxoadipate aldolase/oxaloacetate decarboxylase [Anaerolineae bacterium]
MTTSNAQLNELAHLGVATIYEASGRAGYVDVDLHQLVPGSRVAGRALTVRCGQDDNLMVHAAMAVVQPGDVLVLTMPEPRPIALVGELLATQALAHGVAGMLIDAGRARRGGVEQTGLAIWSRYVRVRGAVRVALGELNVPVKMGGTPICPGDAMVMDADGVVIVAQARISEVLAAAQAREQREVALRQRFQEGELSIDVYGLRESVAAALEKFN